MAEASGEGAKAAMELLQAQSRMERQKGRERMKIGGIICIAVGIGLTILMLTLEGTRPGSPYMVGLIPAFVGVALLVYVSFMAVPLE